MRVLSLPNDSPESDEPETNPARGSTREGFRGQPPRRLASPYAIALLQVVRPVLGPPCSDHLLMIKWISAVASKERAAIPQDIP
jgi:hypothetical protein